MSTTMTDRQRILDHLAGKPVDRLPFMPITMAFAAKHAGARYLEYATQHRVLVDAQIRVAEDFGIDYVNTMSDPAGEAADCGAKVRFFPDQPPALDENEALLGDKAKLVRLAVPRPDAGPRMYNRLQALGLYRARVGGRKLIEGWVEGPCAQSADLRGINTLMMDFYDDPDFVRDLFEFVHQLELGFAKAQVAAGAEMIGIGDAAASLVGPRIYEEFVWPAEKRLIDDIKALGVPVRLHICGDTRRILSGVGRLACDMVDLDSLSPVQQGRNSLGPAKTIIGNLDPVRQVRNATPEQVLAAITQCHKEAGPHFVVGAGCEIPADTPPANVMVLGEYARSHGA